MFVSVDGSWALIEGFCEECWWVLDRFSVPFSYEFWMTFLPVFVSSEGDFGRVFGARGLILGDFWDHFSILGGSLGSLGGSLGYQGRPKRDFKDFLVNFP